jgi:hypothetical protein
MLAATTAPSLRLSRGNWISSPAWDAFWMFSAVWGSAILLILSGGIGMAAAGGILFAANMFIAMCHSWSTTYVVLGSPLLREARRADRRKFAVIPLAIVLGSFALGLLVSETGALPASTPLGLQQWPWGVYLALFWVGHFWHFGNQDFGVLTLYRLKAGQKSLRDRRVDKAYAVAMMFVIQPFVYLKSLSLSPLSDAFFSYVPLSPAFVAAGADIAILAALVATGTVVGYELTKANRSGAKLLYYAVMLAHPTVLYLLKFEMGFFYLISYFWSHWFIAIGLTGRINVNFHRGRGLAPVRAFLRHALALGMVVVAIAPIYLAFGWASVFSSADYKETLTGVSPEYSLLLGFLLGFFLAEQLLHYYCDRCLFRFRDPAVRRAVAALV